MGTEAVAVFDVVPGRFVRDLAGAVELEDGVIHRLHSGVTARFNRQPQIGVPLRNELLDARGCDENLVGGDASGAVGARQQALGDDGDERAGQRASNALARLFWEDIQSILERWARSDQMQGALLRRRVGQDDRRGFTHRLWGRAAS